MSVINGYADLPTLRGRFGIEDPLDDAVFEHVLNAVSRRIDKHCHRVFYDDGAATPRVFKPSSPYCVEVDDFSTTTGLVVKTDEDLDATYELTWAATDYQVEPLNGVRGGQRGWPYESVVALDTRRFPFHSRRPVVQVTARWGWAEVPEPVTEACLLQAARLFGRKDSPLGVAGFSDVGAVTRLLAKLDPDVEFLLQPYRRHMVLVG